MASRKKTTYFSEESISEIVNKEEEEFFDLLEDSQETEVEEKLECTQEIDLPAKSQVPQVLSKEPSFTPPAKYIRNQRNIPRFSRLRGKDL